MFLKTNIKLGEITNLSDARFAAGRGAQFVGFNFTPDHDKYIAPEQAQEIIGWLDGPKLVGEWNSGLKETIWDTAERLKLDYIQLNWHDANLSKELSDWNIIQNINLDGHVADVIKQIEDVQAITQLFLLSFNDADSQKYHLAQAGTKQMLTSLCRDYPVLFNFHFTTENLLPLLDEYKPFGINLLGSHEIKPGYKDFDELNDLIDLLEE